MNKLDVNEARRRRLGEASPLKRNAYLALEDLPAAHGAARAFGVGLLLLIVANALLVGVGDDAYGRVAFTAAFAFNAVSSVVFAVEYALRLWIADIDRPVLVPARARARYARSVMGIVDLLSFLPMAFILFTPYSGALADAVRIVRLVRLVKITRYMRGLKTIGVVLRKCQREIVAAFMVVALLCVASSVLMYEAEHAAQPEDFDSVFTGLYWAMTTMTSTGYGDLVPITPLGRLVGFLTMALSIGVIAIPAGIFSAGFVAEFRKVDERERAERAAGIPDASASGEKHPHETTADARAGRDDRPDEGEAQ